MNILVYETGMSHTENILVVQMHPRKSLTGNNSYTIEKTICQWTISINTTFKKRRVSVALNKKFQK